MTTKKPSGGFTKRTQCSKVVPLHGPRDCPADADAFTRQLKWDRGVLSLVKSLSLLLQETEDGKNARAYVRQILAICLDSDEPFETGLQRMIGLAQGMGILPKPTGPRGVPRPRNKKGSK